MKKLANYLNDHLAGSVAAVELLEHLNQKCDDQRLQPFFAALLRDITADQDILRELLERIGSQSAVRKAAAWLAEKFLRVKIKATGEGFGELGLLEAMEMLALGITGKQLLWRALSHSLEGTAVLSGIDLDSLEQRAAEQFKRVDELRLESALKVFGTGTSPRGGR